MLKSATKKVSIVVLNYRNWQDTLECLESVLTIVEYDIRLIIVDNNSCNESVVQIKKWIESRSLSYSFFHADNITRTEQSAEKIILIESARNGGYAAGNNIGIKWALRARDEYLLILNSDTIVNSFFLGPLLSYIASNPKIAVVGPKILDTAGNVDRACARRRPPLLDYTFRTGLVGAVFSRNRWRRRHYYVGEYDFREPFEVDIISGACFLIRASAIKEIDLLDEGTFLYSEEFILHEKLRSRGYSTWIVPSSVIVHKKGSSIKSTISLDSIKISMASLEYYLQEYRGASRLYIYLAMVNYKAYYYALKIRTFLKGF